MGITFFGKRAFWGQVHMMRMSSIIRIDQIAEYLGAKVNPTEGYENDVCIYMKPHVKKFEDMKFEGRPYLDINDGHNLGQLALKHPEVPVIVISKEDYETMSRSVPNKIIFIPQHHCNFERFVRNRRRIATVGYLGGHNDLFYFPQPLLWELARRKMDFVFNTTFSTRQEVVDFYKTIDIQITWRPYKMRLRNPLKLVNAASFGIPTIALDEKNFQMELEGCYLPVHNFEEFLVQLDYLKNPSVYAEYSQKCLQKAEEYHIDNIAKLYRNLETYHNPVNPTNTYEYILKKYNLRPGRRSYIEIPNMGRQNLAELFAELGFKKGAEIGVDIGSYSEVLCKANPKLHLYSINPWSPSAYEPGMSGINEKQEFFNTRYKEAKKRLAPYSCTIIRKTLKVALKDFEDNSLDFVYIDGNHDFVNFTNDLHYWLKKIRPGGIISGHDYAYFPSGKFNHVKRVIEAYFRCYGMVPYFVVGAFTYDEGMARDRFRSWFWVKT